MFTLIHIHTYIHTISPFTNNTSGVNVVRSEIDRYVTYTHTHTHVSMYSLVVHPFDVRSGQAYIHTEENINGFGGPPTVPVKSGCFDSCVGTRKLQHTAIIVDITGVPRCYLTIQHPTLSLFLLTV